MRALVFSGCAVPEISLFDLLYSDIEIERRVVAALVERRVVRIRVGTVFSPVANQFNMLRDHYMHARRFLPKYNEWYKMRCMRRELFTPAAAYYNNSSNGSSHLISIDNKIECTKDNLMRLIDINKDAAPLGTKFPRKSNKKSVLIEFMWKTLGVVTFYQ